VEITGNGAAAAGMIERSDACLGIRDPSGPVVMLFTLTHPSHAERVEMLGTMDRR
jgi:hypothetical protein